MRIGRLKTPLLALMLMAGCNAYVPGAPASAYLRGRARHDFCVARATPQLAVDSLQVFITGARCNPWVRRWPKMTVKDLLVFLGFESRWSRIKYVIVAAKGKQRRVVTSSAEDLALDISRAEYVDIKLHWPSVPVREVPMLYDCRPSRPPVRLVSDVGGDEWNEIAESVAGGELLIVRLPGAGAPERCQLRIEAGHAANVLAGLAAEAEYTFLVPSTALRSRSSLTICGEIGGKRKVEDYEKRDTGFYWILGTEGALGSGFFSRLTDPIHPKLSPVPVIGRLHAGDVILVPPVTSKCQASVP